MKKYDVVIARYKENLDWVELLDKEKCNIIIYNKGINDIKYPSIPLKNVGRESHTYFTYIIDYYNAFPEFIIFLQGNPWEQSHNAVQIINMHQDEKATLISDHWINERVTGWYEICEKRPPEYPITYLKDVAKEFLGDEMPMDCHFGAGNQYVFHSSIIKNRTKEYYQKILDRFEGDYLLPWHIERLMLYIVKANDIFVYQDTKMLGFKK
jgi:hypothetical protein